MNRHLNNNLVLDQGPTHNFQQMLRLKALNQDRRCFLASINNDRGLQEKRKNDNSYQNPLLALDSGKKFIETARASIKEMKSSQAQFSRLVDKQFCKQKRITPKNNLAYIERMEDSTKRHLLTIIRINYLAIFIEMCGIQIKRDELITVQRAQEKVKDLFPKTTTSIIIFSMQRTCELNFKRPKNTSIPKISQPNPSLSSRISIPKLTKLNPIARIISQGTRQPIDYNPLEYNKARYSDIPMVEFLYQNGGRCKTVSRSLEKKLETMRRGHIQGKTGLRG